MIAESLFLGHMIVSYYGPGFAGRPMANGQRFDPQSMVCAHKYFKFGTKLEVKNPRTGKSVLVVVKDRGPYVHGRDLDLSQGAFSKIFNISSGVNRAIVRKIL